ncbi:MAG: ArsB/NhaD family transporter [Euryarchaeota archaeon]|nr:ArsB/NhaD family transporter [Euryarchaeota archaeon]
MKTAMKGIFILSLLLALASAVSADETDKDSIIITGHIIDLHDEGVGEAEVMVLVDGEVYKVDDEEYMTMSAPEEGTYCAEIELEMGMIETSKITLEVSKPTYRTERIDIEEFAKKGNEYITFKDVILSRAIGPSFYIAAAVLVLIYILIAFELVHRTIAALFGAAILLFVTYTLGTFDSEFFVISFEKALHHVDFNVIGLLMGMMIIVGIMKGTGVFQWMAYKSYQAAKGRIWPLAVILMLVTAVTSAFLDNVTSMVLLTPVIIEIALVLRTSPLNFLIPMVLASNIGGTATLIGDPPNIMIGSYAGLTFNDFAITLAPFVLITLIPFIGMMYFMYRKTYGEVVVEDIDGLLERLREEYRITDSKLLKHSLGVLSFVILLFLTHGVLHMEVSIAALTGASILLLISRSNISEILLNEVEWPTLVFFVGLFIIVGATVETGVIGMIADLVADLSGGSLTVAIVLVMWVAAIASAIVDNIPFTATMLPIVAYLTQVLPGAESMVLWWALAIGACYGGNGTLIGASANVVTAGLSERAGHPISFKEFMKVGAPVMFVSVFLGTIYILIVF